ncbi:hypothetical protein A3862_16215 [Methylobacterium sp. XJLW]|uniref:hypothetical protein n=1 Tax=Methylobacterium sp. XJLW TaxID=739141 RepID=UPI000DAAFAA8|nr:hypothetical protein [Methylobacterium sp. XJLW]AWV16856.1 hypothetical protein A3862_16215 [Methylobacterium sp. XJLW]
MSETTVFVMEFYRSEPGDAGILDTVRSFASVEDARAKMLERFTDLRGDPSVASHQKPAVARLSDDNGFHFLTLGMTSKGIQELDPDDAKQA